MQISPSIALIGSGASGFELSHELDCNVWALRCGEQVCLVDSGAGVDIGALLARLDWLGVGRAQVGALILTHAHADHSGGAAALLDALPKAKLFCGPLTAEILQSRDESLISLDKARGRYYPLDYTWTPPRVDAVLTPGAPTRVGDLTVTLHETPGHSADHCSLSFSGQGLDALATGDAVFADGRVILQDIPDCSLAESLASIRRLAELEFDSFLPGHGRFTLSRGSRHVEAAMVFARQGLPPPQF
jgi:glyoxylase-like metal-dependent hydrolase (beta-lactamase superfamily II)